MRSFWPCLAVILAGLVVAAGSAVALATAPSSRGGHAVPVVKRETPRLPKQTGRTTSPTRPAILVVVNGQPGYRVSTR